MSEVVNGEQSQTEKADLFYKSEAETPTGDQSDKDTEVQDDQSTVKEGEANKTEESKTEEQKSEGDKTEESKEGDKPTEFEVKDLKLSEDKVLQDKEVSDFVTEAKKLGLNKEQTQALLTAKEQERVNSEAELQGQLEKLKSGWLEKAKADPDIGGENLKVHAEHAKRAIDKYGSQELKDALNNTGYGNHPEIIRMFSKIGQEISSGSFVKGNDVVKPQEKSPADIFYGSGNS